MNITINTSSLIAMLQKNINIVLAVFVIIMMLLEALVIKRSVNMVLQVKNQVPNFQTRIVRVNLQKYSEIEKRIQDSEDFSAQSPSVNSPFAVKPAK